MPFMNNDEIQELGLKHVGKDVRISKKASFYNPANISIGDFSRIDDFCIISAGRGGIEVGRYVHIGCYSSLIGQGKIIIEDYSGTSGKVSIYSSSEDSTGEFMCHPTIPEEFTNVKHGPVTIKKHVVIGTGSVVLPNVVIEDGVFIGALSLISKNCKPFSIYGGIPAKRLKKRSKKLCELEEQLLANEKESIDFNKLT
ncbi:MAG: acyltransferase [Planctomycetes bacterium]|nr:acyltransferase [Planctomycetota bacterium]